MLKFDDQFPLHRKVAVLSDGAFRLHVEAIFWSRRNRTDGWVGQDDLAAVGRARRPEGYAAECVQRGDWHRVQDGRLVPAETPLSGRDRETPARQEGVCAECEARHEALAGDGWVIHGYADWQETRKKIEAKSEVKAKAGRAGGIASGRSRRSMANGIGPPRSKREAKPKQRASPVLPNERTPSALSRAESANGAASQAPPSRALCRECSNPTDSAYHRRACDAGRSAPERRTA